MIVRFLYSRNCWQKILGNLELSEKHLGVVYRHYFTPGWDFTSGRNIFYLHTSFTPGWNLYIFTLEWNEIVYFYIFYYEKHSFHPGLNLIFCLHVKNSLFHPGLKFRPCLCRGEISPRLLCENNIRDFLRDRSEFTPEWISPRDEIMHVNYPLNFME